MTRVILKKNNVGDGPHQTMKQPDLFYYFDTEESELLLMRRRTFYWFCAIYGVFLLSGLVATIGFFLTHRDTRMFLIIIGILFFHPFLSKIFYQQPAHFRCHP